MAFLKKAARLDVTVNGETVTITLDHEDAERVSALQLMPWPSSEQHFYHNSGTPAQPVYELLEHYILRALPHEYVEIIDRSPAGLFNFRKSNLRSTSAATPVIRETLKYNPKAGKR